MTHNSLIVSHNGISVKIILKLFCCIGVDLALHAYSDDTKEEHNNSYLDSLESDMNLLYFTSLTNSQRNNDINIRITMESLSL